MVAPPKFTVAEAREALREVHDQNTKVFYSLRLGKENFYASTFRSDIATSLAHWRRRGFVVTDGPFQKLEQARNEALINGAYTRADRPHGLLGRA
jgi:hypothetical protein